MHDISRRCIHANHSSRFIYIIVFKPLYFKYLISYENCEFTYFISKYYYGKLPKSVKKFIGNYKLLLSYFQFIIINAFILHFLIIKLYSK